MACSSCVEGTASLWSDQRQPRKYVVGTGLNGHL